VCLCNHWYSNLACNVCLFCIILERHVRPVQFYHVCPHYLTNGTTFGEKKLLKTKCVFWLSLQLLSETIYILRIIQWDMIIQLHMPSCKVSLIFIRFYSNLNFLYRFLKNSQIPNFMKIHPVGAELFHRDRQTWQS
jgi:hypothetical protein